MASLTLGHPPPGVKISCPGATGRLRAAIGRMQGEGLWRGSQRGLHHIRSDPQHVPRCSSAMFREQLNRLGQKDLNSKVLQDLQGGLMDGLHPILRENTLRLKRIFQDRPTVCRAGPLVWFCGVSCLAHTCVWAARKKRLALAPPAHSSIHGAWMRAIFQTDAGPAFGAGRVSSFAEL